MKTLRFEDRDWMSNKFVNDENGRLIARDEYETMTEFREVLHLHNRTHHGKAVRGAVNIVLVGGLLWGVAAILGGMI